MTRDVCRTSCGRMALAEAVPASSVGRHRLRPRPASHMPQLVVADSGLDGNGNKPRTRRAGCMTTYAFHAVHIK